MTTDLDSGWLIEEVTGPGTADLQQISRTAASSSYLTRGGGYRPTLAVTVHDLTIHNVRKWFGAAEIRVDAVVLHGGSTSSRRPAYHPGTIRFHGVRDGDTLNVDTGGFLVFYGKPAHFLDIFVTVSRDRADSDDLATLLENRIDDPGFTKAVGDLAAVSSVADPSGAITAALAGAAAIGGIAYQVVRASSRNILGLYRGSWLQVRDGFGVGRHPETGVFTVAGQDISFRYEITLEDEG